jgi:DNA-binding LacI/PurR family transcriptional regulator
MGIDLSNPSPLYQQIADDIKAKIVAGKFKVGDSIGSHADLTKQYAVSVITVKKALSDLIDAGYLYSRVGKGTFVARKSVPVDLSNQKTIGLVLRALKNPFFSLIAHGAETRADELGYNILLSSSVGRADKEENQIHHFKTIGADGLVIASMSHTYRATEEIKRLHRSGFPYVMVSYIHETEFWYVGTDNAKGAFLATEHLIKRGCKTIGYVTGGEGNLLSKLRQSGYEDALHRHNRRASKTWIFDINGKKDRYEAGYETGLKFSSLSKKPDALFVYSDVVALGVMQALIDSGLKIPDDVALVGFDDIERAQYAPVPLTTVRQPTEQIGKTAIEILINRIEGKPASLRTILEPCLIERDSCGAYQKKSVA